jgi:hypothetical protein
MAHHSLLSVGQLCNEGYIVTFKQDTVTICNSESSKLLSGPQDMKTGLWRINLKQTNKHIPDPIANNVYELRNTGALVHYLHKALFSPTKSAMLQAVKDGHLITWPGLTEDTINKHLKLTPATAMGHMNQRLQNIRSTSKAPIEKQQPPDTDLGTNTHLVYAFVVDQGQLYTDRLLIAAKDMTDALQNPHPEVPFARVGDDTISALTDLAAIFKLKLRQPLSPATQASPAKVVPHPSLIPSSTQILNSPIPIRRQTRSQTTIHTQGIPNVPLPPRVVTPKTLHPSPLRVPTGSQPLLPRNLSQDDFCGMDSAHMAIALGHNHWSPRHQANAVIHPVTRKEMEYSALMKDPRLQPLWTRGFGNKCGRLFQGIRDIPGTDTCFFIDLKTIPNDRNITYGKIVCDYKPHKKEKERVRLTLGGDRLN